MYVTVRHSGLFVLGLVLVFAVFVVAVSSMVPKSKPRLFADAFR